MRVLSTVINAAFCGTQLATRRRIGSSSLRTLSPRLQLPKMESHVPSTPFLSGGQRSKPETHSTRLFAGGADGPTLTNIGREEMEEIVEDFEEGGREDSGYVVMDVREKGEVQASGPISPNTFNLPLQRLAAINGFSLEDDEFEEEFGFAKPTPDETLVFSCAAGIRSVQAAQWAAASGYTKLVNYKGGAGEWFSG